MERMFKNEKLKKINVAFSKLEKIHIASFNRGARLSCKYL